MSLDAPAQTRSRRGRRRDRSPTSRDGTGALDGTPAPRIPRARSRGLGWKLVILAALMVAAALGSFWVGRYPVSPDVVLDVLFSRLGWATPYWEPTIETVVMNVRLPRILMAMLVGGALSAAGAAYQTLFKNPMVSPDLLGVSAGAGFGAALAMVTGGLWWQIQASALGFGLLAVLLAALIGYIFGRQEVTILVLGGIVVSSFFQALLSIVKTVADTDTQLPSITFWLMGSLDRVTNDDVLVVLPAIGFPLAVLFLYRHQINVLAAGEDEAASLGVNVDLLKVIVIVSATLMTVAAVSITGIIGWVGLVVPHIARTLVGANFPALLLTSVGIGSIFLLMVDNVIRGVTGVELPLGVLTALIGTPIFVVLLARVRKGWL